MITTWVRCESCDCTYMGDVLVDGWICEACLRKQLNEDRFYKFATSETFSDSTADRLEEFFFQKVFRIETPKTGSAELRKWLKDLYRRRCAEDKLLERKEFAQKIHDYIFGNYANEEAYARWLHGYLAELDEKTRRVRL